MTLALIVAIAFSSSDIWSQQHPGRMQENRKLADLDQAELSTMRIDIKMSQSLIKLGNWEDARKLLREWYQFAGEDESLLEYLTIAELGFGPTHSGVQNSMYKLYGQKIDQEKILNYRRFLIYHLSYVSGIFEGHYKMITEGIPPEQLSKYYLTQDYMKFDQISDMRNWSIVIAGIYKDDCPVVAMEVLKRDMRWRPKDQVTNLIAGRINEKTNPALAINFYKVAEKGKQQIWVDEAKVALERLSAN